MSADNVLLINCGDNISNTSLAERHKAQAQMRIFAAMDTAVLTPGRVEFALGADEINKLAQSSKFPLVCSNLKDTQALQAIRPYALIERGGKKILVLAIIDPEDKMIAIKDKKIAFTDPVAALKKYTADIPHDMLIVAARGHRSKVIQWINQVDGIDVLIPAQQSGASSRLQELNGARVWYNNTQGKMISALDVTFNDKGIKFAAPYNQTIRVELFKDDQAVKAMVEEYNTWLHSYQKKKQEEDARKAAELRRKHPYVGNRACQPCHQKQFDGWAKTAHASAINILIQRKKEHENACLPCHTTGMNQGGFISMAQTPHLAGVQCEACHGPGEKHLQNPKNKMSPAGEQVCRRCHNPARDPVFDFAYRSKTGIH